MTRRKSRDGLSEAEKNLWNKVTQTIAKMDSNRVASPLVRRSLYRGQAPADCGFDFGQSSSLASAPARPLTEQTVSLRDADHHWQQKLRRGKIRPEGRIDLHGMSEDRAFAALSHYVEEAHRRGKRFILVITGKGGLKSDLGTSSHSDYERQRGILKTNVPRWLSQGHLATRIVSYYAANTAHGGDGALYVILKSQRGHGA
ncbi:MAG: hypothetical protein COB54_04960 [Alphaproteobacteria bacterium]|nr:MAG: hypothetical protein COB54_04960 [Alphaproteobacteria bacterium]